MKIPAEAGTFLLRNGKLEDSVSTSHHGNSPLNLAARFREPNTNAGTEWVSNSIACAS